MVFFFLLGVAIESIDLRYHWIVHNVLGCNVEHEEWGRGKVEWE